MNTDGLKGGATGRVRESIPAAEVLGIQNDLSFVELKDSQHGSNTGPKAAQWEN